MSQLQASRKKAIINLLTSNNHRLWSAFDKCDPRFSLLCQVDDDAICPRKIWGDVRYVSQHPFVQEINVGCPIQSQLQKYGTAHFCKTVIVVPKSLLATVWWYWLDEQGAYWWLKLVNTWIRVLKHCCVSYTMAN